MGPAVLVFGILQVLRQGGQDVSRLKADDNFFFRSPVDLVDPVVL